jgi:hypothetical protein
MTRATAATAATLIFVDASLPDLATLRAGFPTHAEVHLLPAGRDGLQTIVDTLFGRSGIESLHLLCHGKPGTLLLGGTTLDLHALPNYASELLTISDALVEDGQWLIYGCEVAQGVEGRLFVDGLRLITGLRVAAASHKVGAEKLGGSWVLDDAPHVTDLHSLKIKTLAVPQWQGVLPTTPTDGT